MSTWPWLWQPTPLHIVHWTNVNASRYNWAAGMTQSGANYPFILPLAVDKLDSGFKVRACGHRVLIMDACRGRRSV